MAGNIFPNIRVVDQFVYLPLTPIVVYIATRLNRLALLGESASYGWINSSNKVSAIKISVTMTHGFGICICLF